MNRSPPGKEEAPIPSAVEDIDTTFGPVVRIDLGALDPGMLQVRGHFATDAACRAPMRASRMSPRG
jgi:hypothetical protein